MAKSSKGKLNPDQIPLFTPKSDWVCPTSLPDPRNGKPRQEVGFDIETKDDGIASGIGAGSVYKRGYITGISLAWGGTSEGQEIEKVYIPLRHPETENFPADKVAGWLQELVNDPTLVFITQNGGYDWSWILADLGVSWPPGERMEDTQAAAVIVDENRLSYKLGDMCNDAGLPSKDEQLLKEAAAAYGTDPKGGMWRMPARYVGPYAEQDAVSTLLLFRYLIKKIHEEDTYEAYRHEVELMPMVGEMRRRGVRIDCDKAEQTRDFLFKKRDETLQELSYKLGHPNVTINNIDSPQWMARVFSEHNIPFERTEKSGQGSFKNEWMKKSDHWLPKACAQVSRLHMAGGKFVQGFLLDFAHKGRLHGEIHQFRSDDGGTVSHRFSYGNPPLQQMPSRDAEIMTLVRGLFLPEDGELWGALDYSQQEYRLIVHFAFLAGLEKADEAAAKYINDPKTDFHSMVAELTGLDRKPAKDTNFAKAFGAGVNKFALMTGKSVEEAAAIMEQYDREMPFVKQLGQRCQSLAERRGWVKMLDGAKAHFDMWEPSWRDRGPVYEAPRRLAAAREKWEGKNLRRAWVHKAMNRLIQGSAARQMKMAMLQCWKEGLVPMLQVHDDLNFSLSEESTGNRVAEILRDIVKLEVPMAVDAEYGPTWGAAAKVELKGADGSKIVPYRAAWDEARRLQKEGPWWGDKAA